MELLSGFPFKTYLMKATIIEPAFSSLIGKLSVNSLEEEGSTGYDPESLRSSHATYLKDLLDGLFLSESTRTLPRLLRQFLLQIDAAVDIIQQDEEIDEIRARAIRAIVDECVKELEGVGERDTQGGVEKLLLALDGGRWFSESVV
jgi:hypothetical protein